MIITIDGPAASGKSSLARALAQKLTLYYLCSGMLYRACAYILHHYAHYSEQNISHPKREDIVHYCNTYRVNYVYSIHHGVQIFFDGQEITSHLKSAVIDTCASLLSSNKELRIEVLGMQRAIADGHDLVADGRDMGSVAFPHADYKFFLTASVDERARRWQNDQAAQGNIISLESAAHAISQRDQRDTIRAHAPLILPEGAITIDNTNVTHEQTLQMIVAYINKKSAA
jgi:cytidylate kinase